MTGHGNNAGKYSLGDQLPAPELRRPERAQILDRVSSHGFESVREAWSGAGAAGSCENPDGRSTAS